MSELAKLLDVVAQIQSEDDSTHDGGIFLAQQFDLAALRADLKALSGALPTYAQIDATAQDIAMDTSCCDISSSSSWAIGNHIRKLLGLPEETA
jgi:hypothetical protein